MDYCTENQRFGGSIENGRGKVGFHSGTIRRSLQLPRDRRPSRSRPLDRLCVSNQASLSRLSLIRNISHTSLPENLGEHGKPLEFGPDQLFLQQASTVLLNLLHPSLALHQYGHCSYWSCRSCSYIYHTDLEVT